MTEQEAKQKWCPMLRENRPAMFAGEHWYACITDKCMMWRWEKELDYDDRGYPTGRSDTDEGYCGLGGTP